MGRVVAIGESRRVSGFSLAGAEVRPAEDAAAVRAAWPAGDPGVSVVVLTPAAARALSRELQPPPTPQNPLVVVLP